MLARPTPVAEANLIEIFSSIQGEGPYLGCRQLFIRFADCNLNCHYCDTPFAPTSSCRVETAPGSECFSEIANPLATQQIEGLVADWVKAQPGLHHSISLTGGEPLLQRKVLIEWLPRLRRHLPIYLETNGTLPEQLEPLLPLVDIIAMDLKLPSLSQEGELWEQHRQFLKLAVQRPVFVKVVFDRQTPAKELILAAELVAESGPEVELILQPYTGPNGIDLATSDLLIAQQRVSAIHQHTRVIPQTHTFLGLL